MGFNIGWCGYFLNRAYTFVNCTVDKVEEWLEAEQVCTPSASGDLSIPRVVDFVNCTVDKTLGRKVSSALSTKILKLLRTRLVKTGVSLAVVCAVTCAHAAHAETKQAALLKSDEEFDLVQIADKNETDVRVCNTYLCAHFIQMGVLLFAQAPDWNVRVISPSKKLYYDVTFKDWVRRGSPINFFKMTALPEWPVIRNGRKKLFMLQTSCFALPYLNKAHKPVPLEKGSTGVLLGLEGQLPASTGSILSTMYQIPKSPDCFPLQVRVWDPDQSGAKYNEVFLFSGAHRGQFNILETTKISIVKKHALPSTHGYKVAHDPSLVWVEGTDSEGMSQLMK